MNDELSDVAAVVVHYETPELLERCLVALRASEAVSVESIVIDNASRGFDPALVAAADPDAQLIRNERNVGFAAAANQGLRKAHGRYLLLLNPDAVVERTTLATMVRYMDEHPDVGCATARLVMDDGRLDLACRRSFPTPIRSFYRLSLLSRLFPRSTRFGQYNLTFLDERQEAEIDAPCGAFMMVRREVIDQVGLLDERYFMYGEDLDWAWRIKHAGWRVRYVPTATALHVKRAASRSNRQRTIRAFHQSMRIFYADHYQQHYPRLVSWLIYRAIDAREVIELSADRLRATARTARP